VSNQGRAAALRTIRHLHLDRAAELGVPPERQLAVLAAADHATALTLHSSQVGGLVACLLQGQQQQQVGGGEEEVQVQAGTLQLSLRDVSGVDNTPTSNNAITTSSSHHSCHPIHPRTTLTSTVSSGSAANAAASHPTLPAAKPRGPYFKQLTVTGPVTAATIQHLEQLLDLLPGTQVLEEVVLSEQLEGVLHETYLGILWAADKWSTIMAHQGGGNSSCSPTTGPTDNSISSSSSNWRGSCSTLAVIRCMEDVKRFVETELDLTDLLPLLGSLQQPRTLFLGGVSADQLQVCVEHLQPLRALQMVATGGYDPRLLACVAQLVNLRDLTLDLLFTPITSWPAAMTDLIHLTCLDLNGLVLMDEALEGVCSMTGLSMLSLAGTKGFESLPTSISQLVRLNMLGIEQSEVVSLPEAMTALTALRMLAWSALAPTAPLQLEVVWRLKSLRGLLITDHHLAPLPDAISQLSGLRALQVTGHALAALPTSLSALVDLVALQLQAPQLRSLPKGITALTQLEDVTAPGVVLQEQSPPVQAFLTGRQARGCRLTLARSDGS
jgi:hypothetical protein